LKGGNASLRDYSSIVVVRKSCECRDLVENRDEVVVADVGSLNVQVKRCARERETDRQEEGKLEVEESGERVEGFPGGRDTADSI
jgi:hypothetical protein